MNEQVVNCLSVDVESFSESNEESVPMAPEYLDRARQNYEIERNMDATLGLFADLETKATFFFLGRIARDLPAEVRKTADQGHEIGCHSLEHRRIFGQDKEAFRAALSRAKHYLEDAGGKQVYGFRAPDFSITRSSLWALDVLQEAGFVYDSSIYPFGWHDVYGIGEGPACIHRLRNGLIEWPLPTLEFGRKRLPFGGGGYFRLFPRPWTEFCISRVNAQGHPCMFYIHPYEVGDVMPRISGLSAYRRFRHYYHCAGGAQRLGRVLRRFRFDSAIAVLQNLGHTEARPNVGN
jgi:polysaccharide deacetylase family protein (PEP-CTERM system associated)